MIEIVDEELANVSSPEESIEKPRSFLDDTEAYEEWFSEEEEDAVMMVGSDFVAITTESLVTPKHEGPEKVLGNPILFVIIGIIVALSFATLVGIYMRRER